MSILIIASASIVMSVAAQFSLKAGMSGVEITEALSSPHALRALGLILTNKLVLTGFVLYGLSAAVWLAVLARWDVSKAYPLVGLGFALTVAIGVVAGEHVTLPRVGGVLLICTGVWLVSQS